MSSRGRRLERVAQAISGSGCTCDGQGSVLVVRFVGPADPVQGPINPGEQGPRCTQHPPRIRFEEYDRARDAFMEICA